MSRAFVKELDEQSEGDLPERSQSVHINYVTPNGLAALEERVRKLSESRDALLGLEDLVSQQQLGQVQRDLVYYLERVRRAVLVRPEAQADDKVHFGASVEVEDAEGQRMWFAIVGEDEADAAQGKISWVSPLARALLDSELGDRVIWRRPAGDKELRILAISKG